MASKEQLELLAEAYPTKEEVRAEILKLKAELNLPKSRELFASDIHGEYVAFAHILKNGCGSIRKAIDELFEDMPEQSRAAFASLVYYPEEKLALTAQEGSIGSSNVTDTIKRLAVLLNHVTSNKTREEVWLELPEEYEFVIEELLWNSSHSDADCKYADALLQVIADEQEGEGLIVALCNLIKRFSVDALHLVGDVYDRGPAAELIMDELIDYHCADVQWGNHDIVWMGASVGQRGCIAHVVRNCARYGNLAVLEEGYGMDLTALKEFALKAYGDDPCVGYGLKIKTDLPEEELQLNIKIQKAMAILQFKVEAQLIDENPSFGLEDRKLLHLIDHEHGTVVVDGVEYEITDPVFPTLDLEQPYALTDEEEAVMQSLQSTFEDNVRLRRHMQFFLDNGSFYKIENGILMYHACVPLEADGSLKVVDVYGKKCKGRALFDEMERYVRAAFDDSDPELQKRGKDLIWYMWLGEGSPLFAKSKMATFEIYLIADKAARKEVKNPYYSLLEDENVLKGIFEDFGMDPDTSHIVSGHVPVKVKDGEDPVKCGGKAMIIDGGFSIAYQPTTGIAGFTLISDEHGLVLATHEPLGSKQAAIEQNADIHSEFRVISNSEKPILVADTDRGAFLTQRIYALKELLASYEADED